MHIGYTLKNTDDFSNRSSVQYFLRIFPSSICTATFVFLCLRVCPTEQIDEGLAGKQRQYEGWIHNLSKELNHYKAANLELSNRLRELCGSLNQQPRDHSKGNIHSELFIFSGSIACSCIASSVPYCYLVLQH